MDVSASRSAYKLFLGFGYPLTNYSLGIDKSIMAFAVIYPLRNLVFLTTVCR